MCDQPVSDSYGNALCWNGEVFGGDVLVPPGASDTLMVFERLTQAIRDASEGHMVCSGKGCVGAWWCLVVCCCACGMGSGGGLVRWCMDSVCSVCRWCRDCVCSTDL